MPLESMDMKLKYSSWIYDDHLTRQNIFCAMQPAGDDDLMYPQGSTISDPKEL
jgi:hypothetical protein